MIDRVFDRISNTIERILALGFIVAVALNFANVLGRYLFDRSITGADEVQIYVMVCMAFLGAVTVTWRRMHLRMAVLVHMLPTVYRRAISMAERLITAALACFVSVFSWKYVMQMLILIIFITYLWFVIKRDRQYRLDLKNGGIDKKKTNT